MSRPAIICSAITKLLPLLCHTVLTFLTLSAHHLSVSSVYKKYNLTKSCIADILNIPDFERQRRLEVQRNDKWHQFVDGEVILKQGFVNKRKGLFARKRMLLLTTGPRLVYVDPVQMVKKGEIPWSAELRVEIKNFKMFFVHTVSI